MRAVHWRKMEKAYTLINDVCGIGRDPDGWMNIVEESVTYRLKHVTDILPAMSDIAEC